MRELSMFFRLLMAAFLLCVGAQQALAQKVLLLTTNIDGPHAELPDAIVAYNNIENEFAGVLASPSDLTRLSVLSDANAISQSTFTAAPGPYDIVIVAGTFSPIDPSNWAVLQSAVANRWASAIIFFVDGCCQAGNGQSAQRLVDMLNSGAGTSFSLGSLAAGFARFPLNTNSPFTASFAGLNPFASGDITYFNNVPANNALYLPAGTPPGSFPPPGNSLVDNVFGLLIPTSQSNNGNGACVFAIVDVSPFVVVAGPSYPTWAENQGQVGPAFLDAATSATGACGLPKVSKGFDKADLYLGGSDNTTPLTITLSNSTPVDITNVNLTDNLPAPLVVGAGAVTNTCTVGNLRAAVGSNAISDTGFTIPPGGCTITVPVSWPNSDAGRQACISNPSVTNTITPGTDFVSPTGQVNTPATATLACHAAQLTVSKQVVWRANVTPVDLTGTSFPVSVVCTGTDGVVSPALSTSITLTTPNSGSVSITPVISSGVCVATEGTRPAPPADLGWAEDPAPSARATLAAPPAANSVLLTNTLVRVTDISITSTVTGGPKAGLTGVFNFSANCGIDGNFSAVVPISGANTGSMAITNVPVGASCTVSEEPSLPAAPAGYAWSGTLPAPVSLVTADTGNAASFVNTLVRKAPALPAAVPALDILKLLLMAAAVALLGMLAVRRAQRR